MSWTCRVDELHASTRWNSLSHTDTDFFHCFSHPEKKVSISLSCAARALRIALARPSRVIFSLSITNAVTAAKKHISLIDLSSRWKYRVYPLRRYIFTCKNQYRGFFLFANGFIILHTRTHTRESRTNCALSPIRLRVRGTYLHLLHKCTN